VRIYAEIDPDNQVTDEIHEDNNTAWAPLVRFGTGTTGVDDAPAAPLRYALYDSYPNPFNPLTTIRFDIGQTEDVRLEVFDLLGRSVATLVNDRLSAGTYRVPFDAARLASGVYLYRIRAGSFVETRKALLVR
jgi:hypothetical protein